MRTARTGCRAADRQIADKMQGRIRFTKLADTQDDCILLGMVAAAGEFPCVVIEMMADERDVAALQNMCAGQNEQLRTFAERKMCHEDTSNRVVYTIIIQETVEKASRNVIIR